MAAVDYERVVLGLKAHIASKRSHGEDELLRVLARLEVECEVPESADGFDLTPQREVSSRAVPA